MIDIVLQVLPSMSKKYSEVSLFKGNFIENFINLKQQSNLEQQLILKYRNQRRKLCGLELGLVQENNLTSSELKLQATNIWDKLQKQKYFFQFSLVDKIDPKDLQNINDIDIVVRALIIKMLTVFDFYLSFIEFYHQKQIRKQMDLGKTCNLESLMIDLGNFSESLALDLTIRQLTSIKYMAKGQLNLNFFQSQNEDSCTEWQDVYFNDFSPNNEYKKMIRSCILLQQKGSILKIFEFLFLNFHYNHSFTHKSIQEFYVAKHLLSILNNVKIMDEIHFQSVLSSFKWENTQCKKEPEPLSRYYSEQEIMTFFFFSVNRSCHSNEINMLIYSQLIIYD